MRPYILTQLAANDLKDIVRYTLNQWGKKQSLHYANLLEKRFQEIADRTAISKSFSNLYPQIRVTHCEHHYIFYVHDEGERPCILAVLHDRMDLVSRLQGLLG
ncbi:type II toxin-antitoxin system RelE/ParE family toxin [Methyloglobulus sp.]|uniref:type II toxin-antitoxin system RelE/ParE family toxin n=1 Tax=Methyloglobulus sp. TaxID=2518622 RepID=UPI0032B76A54